MFPADLILNSGSIIDGLIFLIALHILWFGMQFLKFGVIKVLAWQSLLMNWLMAYWMCILGLSSLRFLLLHVLQLFLNLLCHHLCCLVRHQGLHIVDIRFKSREISKWVLVLENIFLIGIRQFYLLDL
jgi:hypothetical protein